MTPHRSHGDATGPRLILASQSPRRAQLLREQGYDFEIRPSPLHEPILPSGHLSPEAWAEALAFFKARSVAEAMDDGIVLAGDTVVSVGATLFGKPSDRADARRILEALAGTTHQVITGVALVNAATGDRLIRHDRTSVTMRALTAAELESYLDSGAWAGKAGAYGIQDHGDAFVVGIEGSFSNVVGLPVELVTQMLRSWNCPGRSSDRNAPG